MRLRVHERSSPSFQPKTSAAVPGLGSRRSTRSCSRAEPTYQSTASGKGSTITAVFPVAVDQTVRPAQTSPIPDEPEVFDTILLVEDDPAVWKLASRILRAQGYQVLTATSGEEALALYQDYPEPIHMILTDIVMPGMNGRQLVEALSEIRPGLAVVYTSGYTDDVVLRHGVLETAVAYLPKPFTPRALVQKVREVLEALPKQST